MKNITPALEAGLLTYTYGRHKALDRVSLQLPPNRIYGLLGKNGAGKTTLLNLISAAMPVKKGKLKLFGQNPFENQAALRNLCFIREKNMYPAGAKARDLLAAAAAAYPHWDQEYAIKLAAMFHLDLNKRYKQLSRGMESALGLVIGLASRAELTMFDEPSLGLDASARELFYAEVRRDFREHPRTFILSTHLIDEGAELFDDAVILDRGQVLLHEDVQTLLREHVMLVGSAEELALCRGVRVIHQGMTPEDEPMLVGRKGAGFDPGSAQVREISLQKLFVYLTEGGEA